MARTRTIALSDDHLSEEEAGAQKAALDQLLPHLTAVGLHTELLQRVTIGAGQPNQAVESRRHPPQLIVYAGLRKIATISIGPRSGSYLIELGGCGALIQAAPIEVVPAARPDRAAQFVKEHAGVPE